MKIVGQSLLLLTLSIMLTFLLVLGCANENDTNNNRKGIEKLQEEISEEKRAIIIEGFTDEERDFFYELDQEDQYDILEEIVALNNDFEQEHYGLFKKESWCPRPWLKRKCSKRKNTRTKLCKKINAATC